MSEDILVQKTTAEYFEKSLQWDSYYAYNEEDLGEDSFLGRETQKEVVLKKHVKLALKKFNPGYSENVYDDAINKIIEKSSVKTLVNKNKEKYKLFKNGVQITFSDNKGDIQKVRLKLFDFNEYSNNNFLVVRELWIQGDTYRRRPDIVGFVNGIPLLFIELKNVHKDIRNAYDGNLQDYKDTIEEIFYYNAMVVLSNGDKAKIGTITSKYEHFHEWKRLHEDDHGNVDFETLLKGVCVKENFMDIFENFILFDSSTGKEFKILARNHQFLGVNNAVIAVSKKDELKGKLGVFWHTQGSGKSYSMVFFSEKVRRKLEGNFSFLILTDREELENQIYRTYIATGAVSEEGIRAASGKNLKELLSQDKEYVFSLIHKFNEDLEEGESYSTNSDLIVISDEAHRTQYGKLANNMRLALPNASYIGFTGTPLLNDDELTKRIFGDYVSTYDFQKSIDDGATVPLYYENRGEKLKIIDNDLNAKFKEKFEEYDLDQEDIERISSELSHEYMFLTADKRIEKIAKDFVEHYSLRWETGKAMIVCIDKLAVLKMYKYIDIYWKAKISELKKSLKKQTDEQNEIFIRNKIEWMEETIYLSVFSEEQGEVQKFKTFDLDIIPHRKIIKAGLKDENGAVEDLESAFKNPSSKFRIVIVCAMWLTGFDVPSLANLYLDKPLKAHNLMQTIARANRVYEGKTNGLIVDYINILGYLKDAISLYTTKKSRKVVDPIRPDSELFNEYKDSIKSVVEFYVSLGYNFKNLLNKKGFELINEINLASEVVNTNIDTRIQFLKLSSAVIKLNKACIHIKNKENTYIYFSLIEIIRKKIAEVKYKEDFTEIFKDLQDTLNQSIEIINEQGNLVDNVIDISKIDFEKAKEAFEKSNSKRTTFYNITTVLNKKMDIIISKNNSRLSFWNEYNEIIKNYNDEKNKENIVKHFERLTDFIQKVKKEEDRCLTLNLTEEELALFDIVTKEKVLSNEDNEKIKLVIRALLAHIKPLLQYKWSDKEATKANVKVQIYNWIFDGSTGLPEELYSEDEIILYRDLIYRHFLDKYTSQIQNVYNQ